MSKKPNVHFFDASSEEQLVPLQGHDSGDDLDEDEEAYQRLKPSERKEARAADRLSIRLLEIPDDDSEAEDRILRKSLKLAGESDDDEDDDDDEEEAFQRLKPSQRRESRAADRLSMRLLEIPDDDSEAEDRILRKSLKLVGDARSSRIYRNMIDAAIETSKQRARRRLCSMLAVALVGVAAVAMAFYVGVEFVGPPNQPVGPYELLERQEGEEFFNYYTFYEGRDSAGSNGYNMYVNRLHATELGIVNITQEPDILNDVFAQRQQRRLQQRRLKSKNESEVFLGSLDEASDDFLPSNRSKTEPFIYMGSSATEAGPRDSIRLEGNRRFNRGLFIIDLRHMPAGCGVWPAFWLTDEANWPVNGEIDIVEGVNYQHVAKTAMHSTKGCEMSDIPMGTMTGTWDTAQGIPNAKTGIPDMTLRYAQNCFVYDPHQWLNQGCVAVDQQGGTLGKPLNDKGGGVYALEWDPVNHHIRSWVFTPHTSVPDNIIDSIRTASLPSDERVVPDPDQWPLPYAYFAVGDGTNCPATHFRHMRLVFNLAFCGSVAGNRFHLDCKKQARTFDTCNEWVKSEPKEMEEAYWKIRGVYVYQREWERTWIA